MEEVSPKSRRTTALLAICLIGVFGSHRFYIGRHLTATVMLVLTIFYLCTVRMWGWYPCIALGVSALWALVDFIMAVAGTMKDNDGKLVKNW